MKLNLGLLALAVGAFGIGVTEFAPMGLLPVIATDLGVSIPTAGLLISAYALGVMLGAPLMTLTTGRVPRRTLLIGLAGIFTVGNLLAAVSDGYGMLLAARVLTSLNHGAFFGVGSIVAASLVPPQRQAGAVASMFMGLTIANVVGVPLATWAGDHLGWRASFWGIAGLGLAMVAALRLTLPNVPAPTGGNVLAELRVLGRGRVLGALALTVIGSSAMFTVFTTSRRSCGTRRTLSSPRCLSSCCRRSRSRNADLLPPVADLRGRKSIPIAMRPALAAFRLAGPLARWRRGG